MGLTRIDPADARRGGPEREFPLPRDVWDRFAAEFLILPWPSSPFPDAAVASWWIQLRFHDPRAVARVLRAFALGLKGDKTWRPTLPEVARHVRVEERFLESKARADAAPAIEETTAKGPAATQDEIQRWTAISRTASRYPRDPEHPVRAALARRASLDELERLVVEYPPPAPGEQSSLFGRS